MNTKKHPIPEYINLNKLGKPTLVHVRRSQRAKRISIRIRYEKVELIIPNSNFQKAQTFLLNKESWIRRKLESRQKTIIYNPDSLMIFGIEYPIKYVDNMEKKVKLSNSTIIVCSTIENRTK